MDSFSGPSAGREEPLVLAERIVAVFDFKDFFARRCIPIIGTTDSACFLFTKNAAGKTIIRTKAFSHMDEWKDDGTVTLFHVRIFPVLVCLGILDLLFALTAIASSSHNVQVICCDMQSSAIRFSVHVIRTFSCLYMYFYCSVEFQHEDWSESATPAMASVRPEVMKKMKDRVSSMFRLHTVRRVLENAGADKYWSEFMDTVLSDMKQLGDGSKFYR